MTATSSFPGIDQAVTKFSESIDRVRQDLYYCDVSFPHRNTRELRASVHASAYVYTAAAVERFVNDLLSAAVDEITSAAPRLGDLRYSLFALIEAPRLESLQQVRGLKMWRKRGEVFSALDGKVACQLSQEHLPLDGRTIRRDHLETIWEVFGLPGASIPSPLHSLALSDLAEARNKIAHGEERAAVIAGQNSIADTLRLISKIEEIVIHLWDCFTNYLSVRGFTR